MLKQGSVSVNDPTLDFIYSWILVSCELYSNGGVLLTPTNYVSDYYMKQVWLFCLV
jgi:hypothetical protein